MMREVLAAVLVVCSLGTVGALSWWAQDRPTGDDAAHDVEVAGPGGAELFGGQVAAPEATALSLLLATGLDVELERFPGMGSYVRAIEGHRAEGPAGWVYATAAPGGAWTPGDRAPEERALAAGERLAWRWTDG